MTAPDPVWTVAPDGWGDPTIWTDGDHAVASRWGGRISIDPAFTEQVWSVLTRVLAPDEATIERLARDLHKRMLPGCPCKHTEPVPPGGDVEAVRIILGTLTDTSTHGGDAAEIPATCVHNDGTEHPAPSGIYWSPESQRWVRMYGTCDWRGDARDPRRLGNSRKRVDFAGTAEPERDPEVGA